MLPSIRIACVLFMMALLGRSEVSRACRAAELVVADSLVVYVKGRAS